MQTKRLANLELDSSFRNADIRLLTRKNVERRCQKMCGADIKSSTQVKNADMSNIGHAVRKKSANILAPKIDLTVGTPAGISAMSHVHPELAKFVK